MSSERLSDEMLSSLELKCHLSHLRILRRQELYSPCSFLRWNLGEPRKLFLRVLSLDLQWARCGDPGGVGLVCAPVPPPPPTPPWTLICGISWWWWWWWWWWSLFTPPDWFPVTRWGILGDGTGDEGIELDSDEWFVKCRLGLLCRLKSQE